MATETYPVTLPTPEIGSYSYSVTSDSVRSQMDEALYIRRSRTETQIFSVSITFIYSDAQMLEFRNWYANDISEGSEIFNFELAFGDGLKTNTAKFVGGQFDYTYLEGNNDWNFTAQLEVSAADILGDCANYIQTTFTLSGSVAIVLPLGCTDLNNLQFLSGTSAILDLSTATLENLLFVFGSESELDLSTATLESGST